VCEDQRYAACGRKDHEHADLVCNKIVEFSGSLSRLQYEDQVHACVYTRARATIICSGKLHSSCIQENMLTTRSASTLIMVCTVPAEKPAISAVLTMRVLSKTRLDSAALS